MTENSKIILNESLFKTIIQIIDYPKLQTFLRERNLPVGVIFNVITNAVEKLSFDDRFLFSFYDLEIKNLEANLEIHNDAYFDSISIVENKKNILIKLKGVKAKKFLIENNENLDLELIENKFTEVEYTNNLESRRLCLTDVQIIEDLNIDNSNLEYLYIKNSSIEKLRVNNTKIRNEGIAIKKTLLEGFFIGEKSSIYRINISDISNVNSFGISDSIVNYINIDETVIKSIQFTTVDKLDELTFYKKSEIKSINIYFSLINRFLISEESIIEEVVIQKETSINLFQATNNCKISWITIKKSNIFLFIFYRGISIKYFESDSESNIGDFDMLESTIKSLILTNQTNSYNFQNTEIGLLKLDECKISYINILNGCKIEAYIFKL